MMQNMTASERIANHIRELGDWRGEMLAKLRNLIREAPPSSLKIGNGIPRSGRTTETLSPSVRFRTTSRSPSSRAHHLTIRTVSSTPVSTRKRAGLSIVTKATGSMRQHLRILCAALSFSTVEDQNPGSRRTKQNDDRLTACENQNSSQNVQDHDIPMTLVF